MHSFIIEVKPYKNLLDAVKVWELDENERVQLVYVFQSRNYKRASHEFRDVSSEYTQVIGAYCIFVTLEICKKLVLEIASCMVSLAAVLDTSLPKIVA